MTGKTNILHDVRDDQSSNISLKIWSKTGALFQEDFPIAQTKFSHVKYLAMKCLFDENYFDEMENYRLISIDSKRVVDEEKTLNEERVKHGDEFLLTTKMLNPSSRIAQIAESTPIDEELIQKRTGDLPSPSNILPRAAHQLKRRAEFRMDLNRILLSLIETAHKLLWFRSDAEQIFRQVEKMLSKSSTESKEIPIDPNFVHKLTDLGFTERQAQIALKRTKSNFHAAVDLLLSQPDLSDEATEPNPIPTVYSHNSTFIPFRQFRQKYFQPNPTAVKSLEEMGFGRDAIVDALRICHNNQNVTCMYLIGDEQQQKTIIETNSQEGFDPNSSLFKAIMENPHIQRAVNNPKIFFIMLQLYEDPDIVTTCINEPELGNMILQISRIYNTERYQMDLLYNNQRDNDDQERHSSSTIENEDDDDDE